MDIEKEEREAAAEAAQIGGKRPEYHNDTGETSHDPAFDAVLEAGGGVAEGFEQAEGDLEDHATHKERGGYPLDDAFTPEAESDEVTGVYGDSDDARGQR